MTAPAPEAAPATPAATADVVDPAVPTANGTQTANPPAQEDKTDWKAKARDWENKSKANKAAADELAALKAAQMSDAEKAAKAQKDLETEREALRNENIRYKAAITHGISDANLDLLGSGSEEEVMARAERLGLLEDAAAELAALKSQQTAANTPGPVPALTPGSPNGTPDTSYPASWFPSLRTSEPPTN